MVHHGVLVPLLAAAPPAPAPHRHGLSEVEAQVQETPRHLLLVREAQLNGAEGDVEALNEPLLADRHEDSPVRVTEELVRDEACPDLVVDLVLHLHRHQCSVTTGSTLSASPDQM